MLNTEEACYVGQSETQAKAGLAVAASHVSFIVMVEHAWRFRLNQSDKM